VDERREPVRPARRKTLVQLDRYAAELTKAAQGNYTGSYSLFAASQGPFAAALPAMMAGSPQAALGLMAGGNAVYGAANGELSLAYELLGEAFLTKWWRAYVAKAFNAQSRAQLAQQEAQAAARSTAPGPAPRNGTGGDAQGATGSTAATAPSEDASSTAEPTEVPDSTPALPATPPRTGISAGFRLRPFSPADWFRSWFERPSDPAGL
jgi:hypothetical protein